MEPVRAPKICLSMIVRDESHILRRCLRSVRPWIDHFVVCDTGSVDDTPAVVLDELAGLPGSVHHHLWRDFGFNRSQALELALATGCDYILVIDADEVLVVEDPAVLAGLTEDAYRVEMRFPDVSYPRVNIMSCRRKWRYVGVIHEYAVADPPAPEYLLTGIYMWTDGQGARGKSGTKAARDLAIMQQSVLDEPGNARYWFYLAQGFEVNGDVPNALATYARRATMGGYAEEVWFAFYRQGSLCVLQDDWPAAIVHYLNAYAYDRTRAEPLYWLAIGYHNRGLDHVALMFLEQVALIDQPVSALFVEPAVYQYLRWIHYAVTAYNLGQREDAIELARKVIAAGKAPAQYLPVLEQIARQDREAAGELEPAAGQAVIP